jgi:hypothetical protein
VVADDLVEADGLGSRGLVLTGWDSVRVFPKAEEKWQTSGTSEAYPLYFAAKSAVGDGGVMPFIFQSFGRYEQREPSFSFGEVIGTAVENAYADLSICEYPEERIFLDALWRRTVGKGICGMDCRL